MPSHFITVDPLKTLAIISPKGGIGETTLATCLAVAAEQDGKQIAIFDLDPQATTSFWKDIRKGDTLAVVSAYAIRSLSTQRAASETGADLIIIDGAALARDVRSNGESYRFCISANESSCF